MVSIAPIEDFFHGFLSLRKKSIPFATPLWYNKTWEKRFLIKGMTDVPLVRIEKLYPTDTIKAAPHSFSNEGDAFSHVSELLVLSRSIMIGNRGSRNPLHHRA